MSLTQALQSSLLGGILIVFVIVCGGIGSAEIVSSNVTLSDSEPPPGSNVTVTMTTTPDNGSVGLSFAHSFNQSVESASIDSTSLTDTVIQATSQNGVTVRAGPGSFTPGETVTIEYTVVTAETAGKTVNITGSVTNGQTTDLPARSYTISGTPTGDEADVSPSDLPGDGSESNPYQISNPSELQAMEDDLDANYVLVSDIDASDTAQFNNGTGFDPVGSFTGSFDGDNHTITGLTIDRPDESGVGLFEESSGVLSNVSLTSVDVTGDADVGGLVGDTNTNGIVRNARVSGSVTGGDNVGGLVGDADGTITNSTASVSVTATEDVGGLVGDNDQNGIIKRVAASGSVTGSEFATGGLVGDNDGTITNARASSVVNGTTVVGGIVGRNAGGTIRGTFAVGSVTGTDDVGGLAGQNQDGASVGQSYFDTEATGQSTSAGGATGLTTVQMQGTAAAKNMNLAFGASWQTVSGDYPELIALSMSDSDADSDPPQTRSVLNVSASTSTVIIDPTDTTTSTVTFEITNTGEETESAVVTISESSLPDGLRLEGVSGTDPTSSGPFEVITNNQSATVTFSDIDSSETVTATASVTPTPEATERSVTGSIRTTVEREGEGVVGSATTELITAQAESVLNISAPPVPVTIDPTATTPTNVTFEITNTGEETESAVVTISESSLPDGLRLERVSGTDPDDGSGAFAVITNQEQAEITFSDIDSSETVTATASVSSIAGATSNSINGSVQATVLRDGTTVATVRANLTAQQDLTVRYAGEDGEVGPFDVITAIDDFRQQELGPFEVLEIIQAFRN